MRASRLLRILLILQNRGRMTSARLAEELGATPRTILRDVDAMTESGLPVLAHQGNRGGIELGFNYRTRLTGLDRDEARALGLILATANPLIAALGLQGAADRARAKLLESLPDPVRDAAPDTASRFRYDPPPGEPDPRPKALARAVQNRRIVRIRAATPAERTIHPAALAFGPKGWTVTDGATAAAIRLAECGDINISALAYDALTPAPAPANNRKAARTGKSHAR
ncbi:MAG: helix-turn-helix transcriptional regulator [Paracoccaceae bacterium]